MRKLIYKSLAVASLAFSANVFSQCDDTNFTAWDETREDVAGTLEAVAPGLNSSGCKMSVAPTLVVSERAYVRDLTPSCENSYRARFVMNIDTLGTLLTTERAKVFNAQCITADNPITCSNVGGVQFKLKGDSTEGNILRSFVVDESVPNADNRNKFNIPVGAGEQAVEFQWIRSSSSVAADGSMKVWHSGNTTEASPDIELTGLDNFNICIDQATLGLVKSNDDFSANKAGTAFFFDEFESRRQTGIGVN